MSDNSLSLIDLSINTLIENYQKDRQRRINLYWDYYLGRHYFNVSNERGQPLYGIGKKRIIKNYCKYVVDEAVSALFGKPIDITSYAESQEEKQRIEDELRKIWVSTTGKRKLRQIGLMGGVSGGCFIKFWFDRINKQIIPNILDTEWVTPIFDDLNNIDKITGIIIDFQQVDINRKPFRHTEIIRLDSTKIFRDNRLIEEIPNKYNILPIIYINNIELPNSFDGLSDIQPIYKINDEINYSTSDRASALYYHGNPILAIVNAGAKELELGADRTMFLPDEKANAFYVKRDTDFVALNEHIEDLKQTLLKIARLPDDVVKQMGNNSLSGVALMMLQAPLIKLVSDKQIFYGEGLEQANEIILKMLITENMIKGVSDFRTDIIFPPYLPADERLQAETNQIRVQTIMSLVNNGVLSKETAMEQLMNEGLSIISSVEDELEAIAQQKTTDGNGIFPDDFQNGGDKNNDESMMK